MGVNDSRPAGFACQGWQLERTTDSLHGLLAAKTARSFRLTFSESNRRSPRRDNRDALIKSGCFLHLMIYCVRRPSRQFSKEEICHLASEEVAQRPAVCSHFQNVLFIQRCDYLSLTDYYMFEG